MVKTYRRQEKTSKRSCGEMTSTMKEKLKQQRHQEALELLPWLVNDTLQGKERLRVLNHLNDCRVCQVERDRLQGLSSLVQSSADDLGGDYKPSFEKLMARIAESEVSADIAAVAPVAQFDAKKPRSRAGMLYLATAASVLLAVGAVMLVQLNPESDPAQSGIGAETLSIPTTNLTSAKKETVTHRLAIVFEQNVDAVTLRQAFIQSGAYIVSGPDADGRYVIEVVKEEQVANADLLKSMSALDGVRYVALLD